MNNLYTKFTRFIFTTTTLTILSGALLKLRRVRGKLKTSQLKAKDTNALVIANTSLFDNTYDVHVRSRRVRGKLQQRKPRKSLALHHLELGTYAREKQKRMKRAKKREPCFRASRKNLLRI